MASTSRQQRRQRRAQAAGTPPLRPPARPTANGGDEPRQPAPEARTEETRSRGGFFGFVQEAIAELKKVEWPGQHAVVSGTAVVLVACLLVGVFLYANDRVWSYLVQHFLVR